MLDLTKDPRPKIMIGSPTSGSTYDGFSDSLWGLFSHHNPERAILLRRWCAGSNIAENQCTLAGLARDWGADYLLLIETDVIFPNNALDLLLEADKDIIGATTQYKEHDLYANMLAGKPRLPRFMGHDLDGSEFTLDSITVPEDPIRQVKSIPMGLTLIKMSALDAVSREVANRDADIVEAMGDAELATRIRSMWGPPFFHKTAYAEGHERGSVSTTDMTFCAMARSIGLEIWLHRELSVRVGHWGFTNFGLIMPERAE